MDENKREIKIDYPGILQQIADKALIEFVSSIMPDESTRKILLGIITVHRKYGIDASTSMKIIMDLAEIFKEEPNESDR